MREKVKSVEVRVKSGGLRSSRSPHFVRLTLLGFASSMQTFEELTSYVDSSGFSTQKKKVLTLLNDPDLPSDVAVMICNWFFRTIKSLYTVTGKDRKELYKKGCKGHRRARNILTKGTYLNYIDRDATLEMAKFFYVNRFDPPEAGGAGKYFVLQLSNDVSLVKGLIQDPKFPDERLINHFCKWIKRAPLEEQRSNLLDVLLANYGRDERVKEIHEKMRFTGKDKGLYGDQQNVHDEEISEATLAAAESLMTWFARNPIPDEEFELCKGDRGVWVRMKLTQTGQFEDAEGRKTLDLVLTRLTLDQASFGNVLKPFGIMAFIMGLLRFIGCLDAPYLTYPALKEEVTGMRDLCSSGYVERGIMVLQGVPGCEEFEIRISEKKRLFSVLSSKLAGVMKNAPEGVLLGTCDEEHQSEYLEYLESKVQSLLPGLSHFGDSLVELLGEVMDDYSEVQGWSFDGFDLSRPV